MTEKQILAIKCAHADLLGSLQNYKNQTYSEHDWESHLLSIEELQCCFPFLIESDEKYMSLYIHPPSDQPANVLVEYTLYVEGKLDVDETPLPFNAWAILEVDFNSPISKYIVKD